MTGACSGGSPFSAKSSSPTCSTWWHTWHSYVLYVTPSGEGTCTSSPLQLAGAAVASTVASKFCSSGMVYFLLSFSLRLLLLPVALQRHANEISLQTPP